MSSRRTLILVGAIVIGAIAALLILRYVGSIEDKANRDNQLVPVVVATGDIAKGEEADAAILTKRLDIGNRRKVDLPVNAVTRLDDIKGQRATIDLAAGEIITLSKFAGINDSSSRANALSPGNVAVTVALDSTRAVAGLIQPGDYVNILVDAAVPNRVSETGAVSDDPNRPIGTTYVFQKVKVLAVGSNLGGPASMPAGDTTGTTAPPATSDQITFEVPPEAATVIAATAQKNLRLVLVRPDYQPRPIPAILIDPFQPLPGEQGRTPYEGVPATAAPTPGASR